MALTSQQIVVLRVPDYAGDSRLDDYQTLAECQTGSVFGDCYNLAVALLMLHWLTMDDSRGATPGSGSVVGGVKGEKEGDLQKTYTGGSIVVSQRYPDLSQTIYGNELIELRKKIILNPRNRMVSPGETFVLPTAF